MNEERHYTTSVVRTIAEELFKFCGLPSEREDYLNELLKSAPSQDVPDTNVGDISLTEKDVDIVITESIRMARDTYSKRGRDYETYSTNQILTDVKRRLLP